MTIDLALIERACLGETAAWQQLLAEASPRIERHVRSSSKIRKCFRDLRSPDCDCVHDVRAIVFQRLASQERRNLRLFLDSAPTCLDSSFAGWLNGLTEYAVKEYLRRRYGSSRRGQLTTRDVAAAGKVALHKRDVQSFAKRLEGEDVVLAQRVPLSGRLAALEVAQYVQGGAFSPLERDCLDDYLEDKSYADISKERHLGGADAAESMIRRLKQRLRTELMDGRVSRQRRASRQQSSHAY